MLRSKSFVLSILALAFLSASVTAQGTCDVADVDKLDCGFFGIDQTGCEAKGCCWVPVSDKDQTRDTPWCFYDSSVENPCKDQDWVAADPGFTQADYDAMYTLYAANLNVENCGAVVAAPDQETPGGSYYYHWMRDAGLSIKAWLEINNNDLTTVREKLDPYVDWVELVQHKVDQNVDVRIEPKFYIPTGEPYDGGWCRPQTDGPALRAMALSKYGTILFNNGEDTSRLWSMIQFDLEWVLDNWESSGCDLWEEVQSEDFYFNRMAYVYSLNIAADFGELIGDAGPAGQYRTLAETVKTTAMSHWDSARGFIYESTNREQDGAVIHSIATFGEYLYPPTSEEAASTISVYAKTFCQEYAINRADSEAGMPGILFGRYPGDTYAGGNPWQLLTAVLGETFYLGATGTLKSIQEKGQDYPLVYEDNKEWLNLLNMPAESTAADLAARQIEAGDSVMKRLHSHLGGVSNRVDEQIDKNTGEQASARGLTWSYANILHSLWVRDSTVKLRENVLRQ